MKTLETERVILRSWSEADVDDFYEYAKNPNVGPSAGWEPHKSKEKSLEILRKFIKDDDVWAIVYKDNNKVIGSLGLHKDEMRTSKNVRVIGYVLAEDYWNKGIMTEAVKCLIKYAFEEMQLEYISIDHYPFNDKSKRIIQKCGFIYEGTLRYARKIYDGTVYDAVCYSMSKQEWFDMNMNMNEINIKQVAVDKDSK